MRTVLAAFFASRLLVAVFVYWGHCRHPYLAPVPAGFAGVHQWWLNPWTPYDAGWYLRMASHGYEPYSSVFFPLYPALLQPFAANPVIGAAWGVLLSNALFIVGLWTLHELTRRDLDEPTAQRAVWLTALCPTAAIFSSVYTESLFLPLLCGTFLALRTRRYALCAALGFCAGLTRNLGPLLAIALLLEAMRAYKKDDPWQPIAWCAITPVLGFVWVQFFLRLRFGAEAGLGAQSAFGRTWMPPWIPLWRDVVGFATPDGLNLVALLNVVVIVGVPLLVWRFRRQIPVSYAVLLLGVVAMNLILAHSTPPYTNSTLRYVSTCFPFAQLLALAGVPLLRNRARLVVALCLLVGCCALFSYAIGDKQYMMG